MGLSMYYASYCMLKTVLIIQHNTSNIISQQPDLET